MKTNRPNIKTCIFSFMAFIMIHQPTYSQFLPIEFSRDTVLGEFKNLFFIDKKTYIPDSVEVTFLPGSLIMFMNANSTLYVEGSLKLKGNENAQIELLQANPRSTGLPMLYLSKSSDITIEHCLIKDAYKFCIANQVENNITIKNSQISNCIYGISGYQSKNIFIDNCSFSNNSIALEGVHHSISNSTFIKNNYAILGLEPGDSVVNCTFSENTKIAIEANGSVLLNNLIQNNTIGIDYRSRTDNSGQIKNNSITFNTVGISTSYMYYAPAIEGNAICYNSLFNARNEKLSNINMSNNCWCLNEVEKIQLTILDHQDETLLGDINIEPVSTHCEVVRFRYSDFYVTGFVHTSEGYANEGKVYLIDCETYNVSFSTEIHHGSFIFDNASKGRYHLLAIPGSESGYLPTYYPNDYSWSTSHVISLNNNISDLDIYLNQKTQSNTGPGSISGNIIYLDSLSNELHQTLHLFLLGTQNDFTFTKSTDTTHFRFVGLPNDIYNIGVNNPGLETKHIPLITLKDKYNQIENITIYIEKEQYTVIIPQKTETQNYLVFPNPCKKQIRVLSQIPSKSIEHARITDLNGKIWYDFNSDKSNMCNLTIEIEFLQAGVYILHINNENFKILKL